MSGIAGILRRDGGPVPEKWGNLLEQSLMQGGGIPFRFEDSIPVEHGDLHICLLSGSGTGPDTIVDGDLGGECSYALWNEETLELELGRKGTGQNSLYWFDLAEAGDGLLFCTNPLPLLKIARELELHSENLSRGIQEYLHYGFVAEGSELLSPVCSMPIQNVSQTSTTMKSTLHCDFSTTVADDVQTLVNILGTPFADADLLSTLQQYRYAKEIGCEVTDGLLVPEPKRVFERVLPTMTEDKQVVSQRNTARRVELGAIARYVGVDLIISENYEKLEPISFPLASWLRSPQSKLGQLACDTLHSPDAFGNLPIDQKECAMILDAHLDGEADNSREVFPLLTLALWSGQVRA
jgi:hypothetical protein